MVSFTFEDLKSYLKKQGIIVKEFRPVPNFKQTDDISFSGDVKVAFKAGKQKNRLFNYHLVAGYYRLITWDTKTGERYSFGFNDCKDGVSWPEFLINKNLQYAETMREKSLKDKVKVAESLELMEMCVMDPTNYQQVEKDFETLKSINRCANKFLDGYAKKP